MSKELSNAAGNFGKLPIARQVGVILGFAASIALGIYIYNWAKSSDYIPLYANISPSEVSNVIDEVAKLGVKYKYDASSGGIMIQSSKVDEVRIKLASMGIPKQNYMGNELLDLPAAFGTTKYLEQVKARRALEGELARTIAKLDPVRSARVHIATPKDTSFLRRNAESSASVMLELYGGKALSSDSVLGIVNLVAASVPNLEPKKVRVVDGTGALLSTNERGSAALASERLNYIRNIERLYTDRISKLLGPLVGYGRFKAEVTVDVDYSSSESTSEKFEDQAVRNETNLKEERTSKEQAGGAPGALANNPQNNVAGTLGSDGSSRTQNSKNYELDRTIEYKKENIGAITKMSVALVLDHKAVYDGNAEPTISKMSEEQVKEIVELVKSSVGFSDERGDTMKVVHLRFADSPPITEIPEIPMYQQPWFQNAMKIAAAFIGLIIFISTVLRPFIINLAKGQGISEGSNFDKKNVEYQKFLEEQLQLTNQRTQFDNQVTQAKRIASSSPEQTANVINNWLEEDERK